MNLVYSDTFGNCNRGQVVAQLAAKLSNGSDAVIDDGNKRQELKSDDTQSVNPEVLFPNRGGKMEIEIFVGLLVVLGIITVVGHAIWWTLAKILHAFLGKSPQPIKAVSLISECAGCGLTLGLKDDFCPSCGRPQKVSANLDPLADLAMASRQIDRFLNLGKIDLATHRSVTKAIEEERERLTRPMRPQQQINPVAEASEIVKPARVNKPATDLTEPVAPPVFPLPSQAPKSEPVSEPIHIQPEPPREPRRSFAEMLETFMEESSIRWGEIVGGLLIIGCSLALVISLWSQITAVPLLKFSVFVGVTAGLFGIGFYSAHRWKLPTTSRGALTISILLVPLNFLAMTAFSQTAEPNALIILGGEFAALALFLFLVYQAGKVILPNNSWLLAGVTLVPSVSMLVAKHWQSRQAAAVCLGAVPLVCYWLASWKMLRNAKHEESEQKANRVFILLGIASFAAVLPFSLLLIKSGIFSVTARSFAAFITLFGVPAIACGLTLRDDDELSGKTKTVATSIALLGALLAFGGLALAWPRPVPFIRIALINCVVCGVLAWRLKLRLAHVMAVALFALAYLLGANVLFADYPYWIEDGMALIASLWTRTAGIAWLTLFVLFASAAELWRRAGRKAESHLYEFAVIGSAFFSLLILTWHGFGRAGDSQQLTLVYLFFAAASFVIAWYRKQFIASWIGLNLSLLALLQAFAFKFAYQLALHHPVRLSVLTFASLATIAAITLRTRSEDIQGIFVQPAATAALISSIAVAPFVLFGGWMTMEQMTIRLFWLATIWFALAVVKRWPILFTAFQALLALSVFCGVAAVFDARALPSHLSWSDPLRLQAQGIALVLLSLMWVALRLKVRRAAQLPESRAGNFEALLFPPWPKVDHIVVALVWLLLIAISLGSVIDWNGILWLTATPFSFVSDFSSRARGFGAWVLLLALLLIFIAGLWEQFRKRLILAAMTLLACGSLLAAGRWSIDGSTVATLRWLMAISFALVALPIIFRNPLRKICERFNWPQMRERSAGLASLARAQSLALFAAPVLALTAAMLLLKLGTTISFGTMVIFLAPVLIVSLTLASHAIREQSAVYAFSSGGMLNLAVTIGWFLSGDLRLITALQLNVIVSATVALIWLWFSRRQTKEEGERKPVSQLLKVQIGAVLLINLVLSAFADARIAFNPDISSKAVKQIGNGWGWLAMLMAAAAWLELRKVRFGASRDKLSISHIGVALLVLVSLFVSSLSRVVDGWASYHALMIGVAVVAWVIFALRAFDQNWLRIEGRESATEWTLGLGLAQFALTLRGIEAPNSIWWTVSFLAVLSLLLGWMTIVLKRRSYVYLSASLWNLIASLLFAQHFEMSGKMPEFLAMNSVVLSVAALIWLWLDWKLMRPADGNQPFHRQAIFLLLPTIFWLSGFRWLVWVIRQDQVGTIWLNWLAILSVAALLIAYFWENNILVSLRGLHLLGGITLLEVCCLFTLSTSGLIAITSVSLSLYALAVTGLWRKREALAQFVVERMGILGTASVSEFMRSWLMALGSIQAGIMMLVGFVMVFSSPSLGYRLLTVSAVFAMPASFALLVQGYQDLRLITWGIRLFLLNLVVWSWAWLSPVTLAGWQGINRLVLVMLIAETVLIIYRLIVMRRVTNESLWRTSLRSDLPIVAIGGLTSLAIVLAVEFQQFVVIGAVLIGWAATIAVLLTLLGVCILGIAFAILPGEDPFDLDERGRMRYVYASEVFLVLAFAHVRMTMPWVFGGRFAAYWPIFVMGLAFAGVGLAEFFGRQGKQILAEPLGKTGVLLPLLPVIGFWVLNSEVPYSGLLLIVGLFYGVLSVVRRSFTFGILAAVAGNAGFWHFLNGVGGLAFYEHPQLWLIPAALSVLLAARINRDSLSADQLNSIRYGALVTIYVSSTADIFLNGVTDSPWLPIILAALAVAGVASGLMLRIRAFLFLGTAFLLLSMLTMIWSASVNLRWTWLWYVTGIGFGILIIYTVAMFERKREQMLGFLERLKEWQ